MWRRLRPPTRAPVAIAGLAAFPLFFAALLCVSLAIERPHRFQWRNARGKLIEIDHQPTTAMEAKIWAIALVVPLVLVVVGLAASFWRRGGVYVVSAAVVVVAAIFFIFLTIPLARFTDHLIAQRELRERAQAV